MWWLRSGVTTANLLPGSVTQSDKQYRYSRYDGWGPEWRMPGSWIVTMLTVWSVRPGGCWLVLTSDIRCTVSRSDAMQPLSQYYYWYASLTFWWMMNINPLPGCLTLISDCSPVSWLVTTSRLLSEWLVDGGDGDWRLMRYLSPVYNHWNISEFWLFSWYLVMRAPLSLVNDARSFLFFLASLI